MKSPSRMQKVYTIRPLTPPTVCLTPANDSPSSRSHPHRHLHHERRHNLAIGYPQNPHHHRHHHQIHENGMNNRRSCTLEDQEKVQHNNTLVTHGSDRRSSEGLISSEYETPSIRHAHHHQKERKSGKRKTRDTFFAFFFLAFMAYMVYVVVEVIVNKRSRPDLLIHGYDNFGNVCGKENPVIPGVQSSGLNMSDKPFLMLRMERNGTAIRSTCVHSCPDADFRISLLNRCLPRDSQGLQSKLPALLVLDAFNVSKSMISAMVSDVAVCWKEVTYSASISFLISLLVLVLLRFVAALVIWVSLMGLAIVSALGTTVVWIHWKQHRDRQSVLSSLSADLFHAQRITDHWFTAAITCSVLWLVFVLGVICLRKSIQTAGRLVREAGRAIACMPCLLLQPFWTFFLLTGLSMTWLIGLMYLQSVRQVVIDPRTSFVSYQLLESFRLLKWPYFFAIVWTFHLVVGCQHFVVAGSICRWYFARPKSSLSSSPVLSSYWILLRYSFGSIALASLIVSGVKFVRLLFRRMEILVTRCDDGLQNNSCCCRCCLPVVRGAQVLLWVGQKVLTYLNTNAYVEIALTGKSFASSARRAFLVLTGSAVSVTVVNGIADLLLFLSKILIVLITMWTGSQLVRDREPELTYPWSPLIVSGLAAYFVAHCFLSVYEMAIDSLLICYCEDMRMEQEHGFGRTITPQTSSVSRVLIDSD